MERLKCVVADVRDLELRNMECSLEKCFICSLPEFTQFYLRGYNGERLELQENEFGLDASRRDYSRPKQAYLIFDGLTRGIIEWELNKNRIKLKFPEHDTDLYYEPKRPFHFGLMDWVKPAEKEDKFGFESKTVFTAKFTKVWHAS